MVFPEELRYTSTHEWARVNGDIATVGITDFAQDSLGDIVYVELPQVGTAFKKEEPFGSIESVKAASDLYAPLSGEVSEVNEELADHPEWVNQEPYGKGWMIKLKIADSSEIDGLLTADQYKAQLGS